MKIIQLQAENVKGIKAVQITPEGNTVIIGGENEAGKSSVLDSISAALGGKKCAPEGTLRNGEEKAEIILDTEDFTVTRVITATKNQVKVVPKDSPRSTMTSPQALLDNLLGTLTFDPLDFERADTKKQGEMLRAMVGLDFTEMEANRKAAYDRRTQLNRDLKSTQARLDSMPALDPNAPAEEQSASDLITEIQAAQSHNGHLDVLNGRLNACRAASAIKTTKAVELRSRAAELMAQAEAMAKEADQLELARTGDSVEADGIREHIDVFKTIDVDAIQEKLANVEHLNQSVRANAARAKEEEAAAGLANESSQITSYIEKLDAEKAEAIKGASYPVKGLEARDDGVYLDDVPFGRASQAQRLRACVAIGMAMNPELRVLLVRDGCRLDDNGVKLLGEMAEEADCQIWIERVGKGDECTVIIEDGEVVS